MSEFDFELVDLEHVLVGHEHSLESKALESHAFEATATRQKNLQLSVLHAFELPGSHVKKHGSHVGSSHSHILALVPEQVVDSISTDLLLEHLSKQDKPVSQVHHRRKLMNLIQDACRHEQLPQDVLDMLYSTGLFIQVASLPKQLVYFLYHHLRGPLNCLDHELVVFLQPFFPVFSIEVHISILTLLLAREAQKFFVSDVELHTLTFLPITSYLLIPPRNEICRIDGLDLELLAHALDVL